MIKCHCENIDFGTYKNTVGMIAPFDLFDNWTGEKKKNNIVCIDTCIATEIGYLWHKGVKTMNSCCGHNKIHPCVIVEKESVEKMIELGYKEWDNKKIPLAIPKQTFEL